MLGVVGVHNWQLALFPLEAQEEVWGDDDTVVISSSYAPTGTVERVDGGYLLSGRWSFSSGCDHAGWAFLGGVVPREPGTPPPPDMRTFLVPLGDYRIGRTGMAPRHRAPSEVRRAPTITTSSRHPRYIVAPVGSALGEAPPTASDRESRDGGYRGRREA